MNETNKNKKKTIGSTRWERTTLKMSLLKSASTNRWEEIIAKMEISVMAICTAFEIKTSRKITEEVLIGHIVKLKTKTEAIFANAGLRSQYNP